MKRAVWLPAGKANPRIELAQAACRSRERSAGPQSRHKMRNFSAGLLPNFVCCRTVMRLPVRRVAVLVRVEILLRVLRHRFAHSPDGSIHLLIGWCEDEIHAVGRKDSLALDRGVFRYIKPHGIAERRADHCVGDSRVPARGINDCLALPQLTGGNPALDYAQGRTVLDRSARIEPFGFCEKRYVREVGCNPAEPQERRITNGFE